MRAATARVVTDEDSLRSSVEAKRQFTSDDLEHPSPPPACRPAKWLDSIKLEVKNFGDVNSETTDDQALRQAALAMNFAFVGPKGAR